MFLHQFWTNKKSIQVELQTQKKLTMFKHDSDLCGIVNSDGFIITNQRLTGYILKPSMLSNQPFSQDG